MTVTSAASRVTYIGNGSTTSFGFSFSVESSNDIQVFYTDLDGVVTQLSTNLYSVSINVAVSPNPTPVGGSVTYPLSGSPIAANTKLTILRSSSISQDSSFTNQGTLYPTTIEQSLDIVTMFIQQINDIVGRQLTVAVSDSVPGLLPSETNRAGQILGFDSSGNPIAISTVPAGQISSAMAPVCNAASIAAAQSLLGINASGYLPVGAEFDYPGVVAPQFFFMERHQAVSRAGFPELYDSLAPAVACTIVSGNPVITIAARADGLQPTTGYAAGMAVEATGVISPGATILSLTNTTITLTSNALANGSSCRIFPHGNGDGSTTYNLPDGRAYTYAGMDPQNGTSRLTKNTAQGVDSSGIGNAGGEQAHITTLPEMPVHTHTATSVVTDPGHTHTSNAVATIGGAAAPGGGPQQFPPATINSAFTGITVATTNANAGSGNAHNNVQPTAVRNKIIFAGRTTF